MRTLSHCAAPLRCALVLALISAVSVGCNQCCARTANLTGELYYKAGNYTAAAHEFHRATADDPGNADIEYEHTEQERQDDVQFHPRSIQPADDEGGSGCPSDSGGSVGEQFLAVVDS